MFLPPSMTTTTLSTSEDSGRCCDSIATNLANLYEKVRTLSDMRSEHTVFEEEKRSTVEYAHNDRGADGDGNGDLPPILDNIAGRTNTTCPSPSHVLEDNGNCISTPSMVRNGTTIEEDILLTQQGGVV